jgi:hypothetical protein
MVEKSELKISIDWRLSREVVRSRMHAERELEAVAMMDGDFRLPCVNLRARVGLPPPTPPD